jgi:hypothetical protein
LEGNVQENKVPQLNRMDRHDSAFPEIAPPILICVFVINTIFQVVGQQIFELKRRSEFKGDLGQFPVQVELFFLDSTLSWHSPHGAITCIGLHPGLEPKGGFSRVRMRAFDGEALSCQEIVVTNSRTPFVAKPFYNDLQ